jgi:hypothetical protein
VADLEVVVDANDRIVVLRPAWLWAWGREAALDLGAASPAQHLQEVLADLSMRLAWHRAYNGLAVPLRSWPEVYGVPDWAWEEG